MSDLKPRKVTAVNRIVWSGGSHVDIKQHVNINGRTYVDICYRGNGYDWPISFRHDDDENVREVGMYLDARDAEALVALLLSDPQVQALHDQRKKS